MRVSVWHERNAAERAISPLPGMRGIASQIVVLKSK
jgi:hypothetical protein